MECSVCTLHNAPNTLRCLACDSPLSSPKAVPVHVAVPVTRAKAVAQVISPSSDALTRATEWVNEAPLTEMEKNLTRIHLARNPASATVLLSTPLASRPLLVRSLIGQALNSGQIGGGMVSASEGLPVARAARSPSESQRPAPFANFLNFLSALPPTEAKAPVVGSSSGSSGSGSNSGSSSSGCGSSSNSGGSSSNSGGSSSNSGSSSCNSSNSSSGSNSSGGDSSVGRGGRGSSIGCSGSSSSSSSGSSSSCSSSSGVNISGAPTVGLSSLEDEERKINLQGVITPRQREQFLRDGYLLLRGLVTQQRCEVAIKYIESPVEQQGFLDRAVNAAALQFADDATGLKLKLNGDVNGLYKGSVVEKLARNLVSNHLQSPWAAQVAPIPGRPDLSPTLVGVARAMGNFGIQHTDLINKWKLWHIDGVDIQRNNVTAKRKFNFTLLCGVYLTNISADFAGNFCVFPGSHLQIQQYARERGTVEIEEEGLKAELIPLGVPIQLQPQAGDVMFAHYQLAHTVAPNLSPSTRHAVYFRLFHKDHASYKFRHESMTDVWLEYENMWPTLRRNS